MAFLMIFARAIRTGVSFKRPEEIKQRIIENRLNRIRKNIAQPECRVAKQQVTRIRRTIRHDREFRGACRTSHACKRGSSRTIRHKSVTNDTANIGVFLLQRRKALPIGRIRNRMVEVSGPQRIHEDEIIVDARHGNEAFGRFRNRQFTRADIFQRRPEALDECLEALRKWSGGDRNPNSYLIGRKSVREFCQKRNL